MPTLSSLLVERDVATLRRVEDALARQVVFGGDLATNLLEVADVDEALLVQVLAEAHGLDPAPVGELAAPQDIVGLVPADVALRYVLYPLERRDGALHVAVAEPLAEEVEQDLAFSLATPLRQRVAPLLRVRQALGRDYGALLERRALRVLARLDRRTDLSPSAPPASPRVSDLARLARAPDLSFGALSAGVRGSSAPPVATVHVPEGALDAIERALSAPAPASASVGGVRKTPTLRDLAVAPPSVAPPEAPLTPQPPASAPPGSQPRWAVPPSAAASSPPAAARASLPPPDDFVRQATAQTALAMEQRRARTTPLGLAAWAQRASQPPVARVAAGRRRGPLPPVAAEAQLSAARTRDEVLVVLFDFARQYFEYTALFLVQGDLAEGRDAYGPGASREDVRRVGVALELPSVLATAVRERAPISATLAREGIDATLAVDLGRAAASSVLLVPIVVRGRTVAVLYGDHGTHPIELEAASDVIAFAPVVARAFERIIVERKLGAFRSVAAPPPAAPSRTRLADLAAGFPVASKTARPELDPVDAGWSSLPPPVTIPPAPPAPAVAISSDAVREPSVEPPPASLPIGIAPAAAAWAVSARQPPEGRQSSSPVFPVVLHADLVTRVIGDDAGADAAFRELLSLGESAVPALFARFPGPVAFDPARVAAVPARPSECGPLLRVVSALRTVALPALVDETVSDDVSRRFWATCLLGGLDHPDAARAVAARLFDDDETVRRAALEAARSAATGESSSVLRGSIEAVASSADVADRRRRTAVEALSLLGLAREPASPDVTA